MIESEWGTRVIGEPAELDNDAHARAASDRLLKSLPRLSDEDLSLLTQMLVDVHNADCAYVWDGKVNVWVPRALQMLYLSCLLEWKSRNASVASFTANERITTRGAADLRAAIEDKVTALATPRYATPEQDTKCFGSGGAEWKMLPGAVLAPPARWPESDTESTRWWEKTVGAQKARA